MKDTIELLLACEAQFRYYEEQHNLKNTPDSKLKAIVNRHLADDIARHLEGIPYPFDTLPLPKTPKSIGLTTMDASAGELPPSTRKVMSSECLNCGEEGEPDWDGQCRKCRHRLFRVVLEVSHPTPDQEGH